MEKGAALWKTTGQFLKKRSTSLPYDAAITSGHLTKRNESRDSKGYSYIHADGSIIHESQMWKQSKWPPTDNWISIM